MWRAAPKAAPAVKRQVASGTTGHQANYSSGDNTISVCPHLTDKDTEALKDEESCQETGQRRSREDQHKLRSPAVPTGLLSGLMTQATRWQTQVWDEESEQQALYSKVG